MNSSLHHNYFEASTLYLELKSPTTIISTLPLYVFIPSTDSPAKLIVYQVYNHSSLLLYSEAAVDPTFNPIDPTHLFINQITQRKLITSPDSHIHIIDRRFYTHIN